MTATLRCALVFALLATTPLRSADAPAKQPNIIFPLVFPMLLFAVNAGGLQSATRRDEGGLSPCFGRRAAAYS